MKGWIAVKKELPPIGISVECIWRYIPCQYYIKIGLAKPSDSKTFVGMCFRKADKKMMLGWRWACNVGAPSSTVEYWRYLDNQLKLEFMK